MCPCWEKLTPFCSIFFSIASTHLRSRFPSSTPVLTANIIRFPCLLFTRCLHRFTPASSPFQFTLIDEWGRVITHIHKTGYILNTLNLYNRNRNEGKFCLCRIGRRKSILLSSLMTILFSSITIASPNVETHIFFKLLHQSFNSGYYMGGIILSKLRLKHLTWKAMFFAAALINVC